MADEPLSKVEDAPLFIVPRVLDGLRAYRATTPLPLVAALADTLLAGVAAHPTRFWVMKQVQRTLEAAAQAPASVRAQLGGELARLTAILGIDAADGVLGYDIEKG